MYWIQNHCSYSLLVTDNYLELLEVHFIYIERNELISVYYRQKKMVLP